MGRNPKFDEKGKRMNNYTIDEINRVRRLMGYSYAMVAKAADVPLSTVQKVLGKQTAGPRPKTLEAIRKGLFELVRRDEENGNIIHESGLPYAADHIEPPQGFFVFDKNQGRHTLEEYMQLPEHSRIELIDGIYYHKAAPTVKHQMIVTRITKILLHYVDRHNGHCEIFPAAPNVKLFEDREDVVLPDLCVVCDRRKLEDLINGAPDLVVEVLSPSNREYDLGLKLKKYREAGVREYWIVDPEARKTVHILFTPVGETSEVRAEKALPEETRIFGEKEKVPVGIWNDACEVDFGAIYESIDSLYNGSN